MFSMQNKKQQQIVARGKKLNKIVEMHNTNPWGKCISFKTLVLFSFFASSIDRETELYKFSFVQRKNIKKVFLLALIVF